MTFLQRLSAILIPLALAACGGGGGSTGSGNNTIGNDNGAVAIAKNQLFVGALRSETFAAFATLTPSANTNITANLLDTGNVRWVMGLGMAYDAKRDRLYANGGTVINVFDKASALSGKIMPTRAITPIMNDLTLLQGMQLDKENDILYVGYGGTYAHGIAVFNNASTLTGSVAPSRVMNISASDFVIDTSRNILYAKASNSYEARIIVFPNQNRINGEAPFLTIRTVWLPFLDVHGLALDQARDRLYAGIPQNKLNNGTVIGGGVGVVEAASTRGKSYPSLAREDTPAALIELGNPGPIGSEVGLAYDPANDRLYAGMSNNVYILDTVSQLKAGKSASAVMVAAPAGTNITTFAFP